jgi:hypothetical protein
MWYDLGRPRRWGAVALVAGTLSCGLFCVGLRWLFGAGPVAGVVFGVKRGWGRA